jgi:hypothetical protein
MTTTKTKTKRTRTKKLDKQLDKVEDMNAPATKTKTKRTRTKKLDKVEAPVSEGSIGINPIENVDIYFNGAEYKPDKKDIQEITFLGTKTLQAKIKKDLSVFWNPLIWDWTKAIDKEAYETKYKRKCQAIYFKEKVFVVEKSKIKKGIVNDEFVDTAELPIGIVVYWSLDTQTWDMLGYKETLLR